MFHFSPHKEKKSRAGSGSETEEQEPPERRTQYQASRPDQHGEYQYHPGSDFRCRAQSRTGNSFHAGHYSYSFPPGPAGPDPLVEVDEALVTDRTG